MQCDITICTLWLCIYFFPFAADWSEMPFSPIQKRLWCVCVFVCMLFGWLGICLSCRGQMSYATIFDVACHQHAWLLLLFGLYCRRYRMSEISAPQTYIAYKMVYTLTTHHSPPKLYNIFVVEMLSRHEPEMRSAMQSSGVWATTSTSKPHKVHIHVFQLLTSTLFQCSCCCCVVWLIWLQFIVNTVGALGNSAIEIEHEWVFYQ